MIDVVYKNSPNVIPITTSRMRELQDKDCQKFTAWLDHSKPGDRFCYYFGNHVSGVLAARLAYRAYESGVITLYQRRFEDKFQYIAQRVGHSYG